MQADLLVGLQGIVSATGLTKEWIEDDRILCYRFVNTERTVVDSCADDVAGILTHWPADRPLRMLIDIRSPYAVISAYAMHRARHLTGLRHDLTGKVAFLVTSRVTAQIAGMAFRAISHDRGNHIIFSSEVEAVAWLLQNDTMTVVAG